MRTYFFAVLLILAVCIPLVSAGAQQGIIQNGKGNTAYQVGDDAFIHVDKAFVKENINAPTTMYNTVTYEAPEMPPTASYLGVGDVGYTRMIYPDRIAIVPIEENTTLISVRAGSPVALYTIDSQYYDTIHGSQSIPVYNEIYDRMEHGSAVWMSWIPYYTTSETIGVPPGADYLVIDNRNIFSTYNLVEIIPHPLVLQESVGSA